MENMEKPVDKKCSKVERKDTLTQGNKSILEVIADSASETFGHVNGIVEVTEPTEVSLTISDWSLGNSKEGNISKNVQRTEDVGVYSTSSDEVLSAFDFRKKPGDNDDSYDTMANTSPTFPKYSLLFGQVYQDLIKRPNLLASILLEPQNKQLLDDFLQGFKGTSKIIPWTVRAGLKHWAPKVPYADTDQLQQLSSKHFPYMKTTRPLASLFQEENESEEYMVELTKAVMIYVKKAADDSTLNHTVNTITSFMNFLCDLEVESGENSEEPSPTPSYTRQRNVRQAFQESFLPCIRHDPKGPSNSTQPQTHGITTQGTVKTSSLLHRLAGFSEFPGSYSYGSRVPSEAETVNIHPDDDRASNSFSYSSSQHTYVRPGLLPYYNTPAVLPSVSNNTPAVIPSVSSNSRAVIPSVSNKTPAIIPSASVAKSSEIEHARRPLNQAACPKKESSDMNVSVQKLTHTDEIDENQNLVDQLIVDLESIQEDIKQQTLEILNKISEESELDNADFPVQVQSSIGGTKVGFGEENDSKLLTGYKEHSRTPDQPLEEIDPKVLTTSSSGHQEEPKTPYQPVEENDPKLLTISSSGHQEEPKIPDQPLEETTTKEPIPNENIGRDEVVESLINQAKPAPKAIRFKKEAIPVNKSKGKMPLSSKLSGQSASPSTTFNMKKLSQGKTGPSKIQTPPVNVGCPSRNSMESKSNGKVVALVPSGVTVKASTTGNYAALHRRKVAQKSISNFAMVRPLAPSRLQPPTVYRAGNPSDN